MCDISTTRDGIELHSVREARRYGLTFPAWLLYVDHDEDACFCEVELAEVLAAQPSAWLRDLHGFAEVDADGRTWEDGFDVNEPHPSVKGATLVTRSDGRTAKTLEDWEAHRD